MDKLQLLQVAKKMLLLGGGKESICYHPIVFPYKVIGCLSVCVSDLIKNG